jgi:hypothetical protein
MSTVLQIDGKCIIKNTKLPRSRQGFFFFRIDSEHFKLPGSASKSKLEVNSIAKHCRGVNGLCIYF